MELSTEQKSKRVGEPWIFHRGIRLVDPALWWFVIIEPNPNAPGHALITVGGAAVYRAYTNTGETISKGGELALRIIRVAMAGSK